MRRFAEDRDGPFVEGTEENAVESPRAGEDGVEPGPRSGSESADIWRDFVKHLTSAQGPIGGQHAAFYNGAVDPCEIARFLSEAKLSVRGALESYEQFIAGYLDDDGNEEPVEKLRALVANLDPHLKRQFLSITSGNLSEAAEVEPGGSADGVFLEMLQKASDEGREISPSLLRLVQRLTWIQGEGTEDSPDADMSLPAPSGDAAENVHAFERLFAKESPEDYTDAFYRSFLERLSSGAARTSKPPGDDGHGNTEASSAPDWDDTSATTEWDGVFDPDYLEARIINLTIALMAGVTDRDDYEGFCRSLMVLAPSLLESQKLDLLLHVVLAFQRDCRQKPEPARTIAERYLQTLCTPEFVERALDGPPSSPRESMEPAAAFISTLGAACIPGLLEHYLKDTADERDTALLVSLLRLGGPALVKIHERLDIAPDEEIEKLLVLIARVRHEKSIPHIRTFVGRSDLSIRMRAMDLLLKLRDPGVVPHLRRAIRSPKREEALPAISLAGVHAVGDVVEDLAKLIKVRALKPFHWERNEAIVASLGRIGDPRALPALAKLARVSWSLFSSELCRLRIRLFESLDNYPPGSIGEILEIGKRSSDPVIRRVAERLERENRGLRSPHIAEENHDHEFP